MKRDVYDVTLYDKVYVVLKDDSSIAIKYFKEVKEDKVKKRKYICGRLAKQIIKEVWKANNNLPKEGTVCLVLHRYMYDFQKALPTRKEEYAIHIPNKEIICIMLDFEGME